MVAILSVGLLTVPMHTTKAATTAELQAQINSLMELIAALQSQLANQQPVPSEGLDIDIDEYESGSIEIGSNDQGIVEIEFVSHDGDYDLNQLAVKLKSESGRGPWDTFDDISLWYKGDNFAERTTDSSDDWSLVSGYYEVVFTNLDLDFDEDVAEQLVVAGSVADDARDDDWDIFVDTQSPDDETSDEENFEIRESLENVAELRISESTNNPDAMTIIVEEGDETDDVEVFIFEIEEENGVDVTIDDLSIVIETGDPFGTTNESSVVVKAALYHDSDELGFANVANNGYVTFENIGLEIDGDDQEDLTVRLTFGDADNYSAGTNVSVEFDEIETAEDEYGNDEGDMNISGSARGEVHRLISSGAAVDVVSSDADVDGNLVTFEIEFDITAIEEDVFIHKTDAITDYSLAQSGNGYSATAEKVSLTSSADDNGDTYRVDEGETETFTLRVSYTPEESGFYRFRAYELEYGFNASDPDEFIIDVSDMIRTDDVYVRSDDSSDDPVVEVDLSTNKNHYQSGDDTVIITYEIENAPAGATMEMNLLNRSDGGTYPVLSRFRIEEGTRTIKLSDSINYNTFRLPTKGTLVWEPDVARTLLPVEGPLTIKVFNQTNNQIGTDSAAMRIVGREVEVPDIKVKTPNGGETWVIGKTNTITWSPYDYGPDVNPSGDVVAYLEKKVGSNFVSVGQIYVSGKASIHTSLELDRAGNYANPGEYYIRVLNKVTGKSDRSDRAFTLVDTPDIKVTAPNGGESWTIGETNTITWSPYDYNPRVNPSNEVEAYLEKKSGRGYTTVGKIYVSGKASIHTSLEIDRAGNYAEPGTYYIRVINKETGKWDRSDRSFKLVAKEVAETPVSDTEESAGDTTPQRLDRGTFTLEFKNRQIKNSSRYYWYSAERMCNYYASRYSDEQLKCSWNGVVFKSQNEQSDDVLVSIPEAPLPDPVAVAQPETTVVPDPIAVSSDATPQRLDRGAFTLEFNNRQIKNSSSYYWYSAERMCNYYADRYSDKQLKCSWNGEVFKSSDEERKATQEANNEPVTAATNITADGATLIRSAQYTKAAATNACNSFITRYGARSNVVCKWNGEVFKSSDEERKATQEANSTASYKLLRGTSLIFRSSGTKEEAIKGCDAFTARYASTAFTCVWDDDVVKTYTAGRVQGISTAAVQTQMSASTAAGDDAHITITSPNGSETFAAGELMEITWDSSGVNAMSMALYKDSKWFHWIEKDMSQENVEAGSYVWDIPTEIAQSIATTEATLQIYITARKSDITGYVDDKSDATFSLSEVNVLLQQEVVYLEALVEQLTGELQTQ